MALPEFSLDGKVAVVTGASRGIGKAIALALADAGADVVVAARNKKLIEETASEIRNKGRRALAVVTDVHKDEEIKSMASEAGETFGKIDILVNNAGVAIVKPFVPIPGFAPKAPGLGPKFFEPTSDEEC